MIQPLTSWFFHLWTDVLLIFIEQISHHICWKSRVAPVLQRQQQSVKTLKHTESLLAGATSSISPGSCRCLSFAFMAAVTASGFRLFVPECAWFLFSPARLTSGVEMQRNDGVGSREDASARAALCPLHHFLPSASQLYPRRKISTDPSAVLPPAPLSFQTK